MKPLPAEVYHIAMAPVASEPLSSAAVQTVALFIAIHAAILIRRALAVIVSIPMTRRHKVCCGSTTAEIFEVEPLDAVEGDTSGAADEAADEARWAVKQKQNAAFIVHLLDVLLASMIAIAAHWVVTVLAVVNPERRSTVIFCLRCGPGLLVAASLMLLASRLVAAQKLADLARLFALPCAAGGAVAAFVLVIASVW